VLFVDRQDAARQPLDAYRVDVGTDDVVTEVSEAGARGEADVAGADDCDA